MLPTECAGFQRVCESRKSEVVDDVDVFIATHYDNCAKCRAWLDKRVEDAELNHPLLQIARRSVAENNDNDVQVFDQIVARASERAASEAARNARTRLYERRYVSLAAGVAALVVLSWTIWMWTSQQRQPQGVRVDVAVVPAGGGVARDGERHALASGTQLEIRLEARQGDLYPYVYVLDSHGGLSLLYPDHSATSLIRKGGGRTVYGPAIERRSGDPALLIENIIVLGFDKPIGKERSGEIAAKLATVAPPTWIDDSDIETIKDDLGPEIAAKLIPGSESGRQAGAARYKELVKLARSFGGQDVEVYPIMHYERTK